MDLLKTMLVYMTILMTSAVQANPAVTPAPAGSIPSPKVTATATAAPVPTATPVPDTAYTTLYSGDRGEAVRRLQEALKAKGYYKDTVDGAYGRNTRKAVEDFQAANGLKADGIAGPVTQRLLFDGVVTTATPVPSAVTPVPEATVTVTYLDEANNIVAQRQVILRASATVYAQADALPAGYALTGNTTVWVNVTDGAAVPASVIFHCAAQAAASPAPAPTREPAAAPDAAKVNVFYVDEDGRLLSSAAVSLNASGVVYAQAGMVPAGYVLVSRDSVPVTVSGGTADPASVTFIYHSPATAAPTLIPTEVPTLIPTEVPVIITEEPAEEPMATAAPIVDGPTEGPTEEPTEEPTEAPTEGPTEEPTEEPTEAPTEAPTEEPTEEPTEVPTEEPTEEPAATAVPMDEPAQLIVGGTVVINDVPSSISWCTSDGSAILVCLRDLADAAGLVYGGEGHEYIEVSLNGHQIHAQYADGQVRSLTVDGELVDSLPGFRALCVEDTLFLSTAVLDHCGAECVLVGDDLHVSIVN